MAKRTNRYELTLKQLAAAENEDIACEQIQLVVENHDELFSIIQKLQQRSLFSSQQQVAEFAIGLKLFSEVMIRNRDHVLFEAFWPAFRLFMERLKNTPNSENTDNGIL